MKRIIILLAIFFCSKVVAQNKYQKGYFINLEGKKTDCLILNKDLLSSPKKIFYKLTNEGEVLKMDTQTLSELKIGTHKKFERHTLQISKPTTIAEELGYNRILSFKEDNILLEVLIDGPKSLYVYNADGNDLFFYKTKTQLIQLQHKKYLSNNNNIRTNRNYIKQLKDSIGCNGLLQKNIKYSQKELLEYFVNYYECMKLKEYKYYPNTKKPAGKFYKKVKFSLGVAALENSNHNYTQYKVGVEFEYVFAINNNKWSIFIEPQYQSLFGSQDLRLLVGYRDIIRPSAGVVVSQAPIYSEDLVNYNSIEVPIGFRHYFFLNNKNALFFNSGAMFDFPLDFDKRYSEVKSSINLFLGLGYRHNRTYSIEFRYLLPREIISKQFTNTQFNHNSFNFKVGYSF